MFFYLKQICLCYPCWLKPTELWAKSKYDVGLIKGCEPVIVTPKSDLRPCKKQYPLKPEAVKGTKPVFQSFQKTGIIVPCENSTVRTLLFPVKKIKDAGQPDEWRFVKGCSSATCSYCA